MRSLLSNDASITDGPQARFAEHAISSPRGGSGSRPQLEADRSPARTRWVATTSKRFATRSTARSLSVQRLGAPAGISGARARNVWSVLVSTMKEASTSKRRELRVRDDNPCTTVQSPDKTTARVKTFIYPNEFLHSSDTRAYRATGANSTRSPVTCTFTRGNSRRSSGRMSTSRRASFTSPRRSTKSPTRSRHPRHPGASEMSRSIRTSSRCSRPCANGATQPKSSRRWAI